MYHSSHMSYDPLVAAYQDLPSPYHQPAPWFDDPPTGPAPTFYLDPPAPPPAVPPKYNDSLTIPEDLWLSAMQRIYDALFDNPLEQHSAGGFALGPRPAAAELLPDGEMNSAVQPTLDQIAERASQPTPRQRMQEEEQMPNPFGM